VVHFSGFHLFERSFLILAKLRTLKGITSWSVFYLIKEKGVIDAGAAAVCFVLQNRSTVCRYWRNFQKCRYEFQV
jgi:hypothetical protein